ncbi:MAG TPA: sigma-54 dependent transcriptional regulator [Pyrinomonadaceae bacterium]|nr:sigma-54 dependent transcriptional regulator [Pyrinomonadaceae bacterium]
MSRSQTSPLERALLLAAKNSAINSIAELQAILENRFSVEILPVEENGLNNSTRELERVMQRINPDLVFTVLPESLRETTRLLKSVRQAASNIPIIVVLETCEPDQLAELLSAGAVDFVTLPLRAPDVLPRAWKCIRQVNSDARLGPVTGPHPGFRKVIGQSPVFLDQLRRIPMIAKCDANVLIAGETGTGKELYARAIHYGSSRVGRPFIPVNCGAIPAELVENELFGHERGAYTSAATLQTGLIEEANGGTLFLDEIDCLPVFAQVKLLRFLQEKEYRPLGSARIRRADVRIIAASNLNLEEAVAAGKVRQDLYYRLNIISLILPPLRERREDISLLARHFLERYSTELDKEVKDFSQDAMQLLMVHHWPGNVRELEHVIERAIVLCEGPLLEARDLVISRASSKGGQQSLQEAKAKEIARFERDYIQGLLSACKGNITRAAQVAKKNRRAFWQLIQKHQIDVAQFKASP